MNNLRTLTFSLLASLFAVPVLQAQEPVVVPAEESGKVFSFEEALDYAETNSPSVQLSVADLADAEGQIAETRAIGIPKVNGSIDYKHFVELPQQLLPDFVSPAVYGVLFQEGVLPADPNKAMPGPSTPVSFSKKNQLDAGLEASALLFDFTFLTALKASRVYRGLAVAKLNQTKYETQGKVAKAYLAVLIANRNLETLTRNDENLSKTLEETEALYDAGFAEKVSVDRLKLAQSNLQARRQSLAQVVDMTKNLLKFQMGYPVDQGIGLSTTLDEAIGSARVELLIEDEEFDYKKRPEYRTLEISDTLNQLNLRRIRAGYYPNLVAYGSFSRQLQRDDLFNSDEADWLPTTVVGVKLNVPIFDGLDKRAKRQRALAEVEKLRIQTEQFAEGSKLALVNSKAQLRNARIVVDIRENSVELAEEIYEIAKIKFNEGVGSSLEVNQAQSELFDAEDALTQALYDLSVAFVDYRDALGQL